MRPLGLRGSRAELRLKTAPPPPPLALGFKSWPMPFFAPSQRQLRAIFGAPPLPDPRRARCCFEPGFSAKNSPALLETARRGGSDALIPIFLTQRARRRNKKTPRASKGLKKISRHIRVLSNARHCAPARCQGRALSTGPKLADLRDPARAFQGFRETSRSRASPCATMRQEPRRFSRSTSGLPKRTCCRRSASPSLALTDLVPTRPPAHPATHPRLWKGGEVIGFEANTGPELLKADQKPRGPRSPAHHGRATVLSPNGRAARWNVLRGRWPATAPWRRGPISRNPPAELQFPPRASNPPRLAGLRAAPPCVASFAIVAPARQRRFYRLSKLTWPRHGLLLVPGDVFPAVAGGAARSRFAAR